VNQKDPGFDRFSPRAFEWRFTFFLNRSGYLNANAQNWPIYSEIHRIPVPKWQDIVMDRTVWKKMLRSIYIN
jgi:predicted component of type VI protein secretion system